jgi:hypothetical protein
MTALLFNHLWQSTLFAGVIAVLALACRGNRAQLRYGLWRSRAATAASGLRSRRARRNARPN